MAHSNGKNTTVVNKTNLSEDDSLLHIDELSFANPVHSQFLPENISQYKNLKKLVIYRLRLNPPKDFDQLDKLEDLTYMNSYLTEFPAVICNLKNLKTLSILTSRLEKLPKNFGNLKKLESLEIRAGDLNYVPDSIGNLANLKEFRLFSMELKRIPDSIGDLSNLEKLDLSIGKLNVIPDSIGKLTQLKELIICSNTLESLPESIINLQELQHFEISCRLLLKSSKPVKDFLLELEDKAHIVQDRPMHKATLLSRF